MLKRAQIILLVLILLALWTTTVYAGVAGPDQPYLLNQEGEVEETPQGAGMLILLMGIGAILLVGGAVLTRRSDSGEG